MLVIRGFSLDPQIQVGFAGQTVQTLNQYRNDEEKGLYSRRWNECAPKAPPIETLPDRTCRKAKNARPVVMAMNTKDQLLAILCAPEIRWRD